ncbi:MAG: hypothetical protein V1929_11980 [bacterium]
MSANKAVTAIVGFTKTIMKTNIIKKLCLVLASVLVLFLCAEIGLRLQRPHRETKDGIQHLPTGKIHDYFYFDTNGCFRIVPHSVGLHRPYEGKTPVSININSQGFRGPEPEANAATRIVFVGDSIVFDGGVTDENTFVRLSEEALNHSLPEHNRPANCLNLGTTDVGVPQYLAKVRHHALLLEPSIIVLGFYLNDSRPPQGFLGEDGYSTAERRLTHSPLYGLLTIQQLHAMYRRVKFSHDKQLSVRFQWADRFGSRRWVDNQEECERLIDEAQYDWGAAWVDGSWDSVEHYLRSIADMCRQQDVLLVVVCFPASPQVDFAGSFPRLFLPQDTLAKICMGMSVPFLDLLPALRNHKDEHLFNDQCHLTSRGNQIVADVLAPWLKAFIIRDRDTPDS